MGEVEENPTEPVEPTEPTEVGEVGGEENPETPSEIEVSGRKFTPEQLAGLVERGESAQHDENWKAANTQESQRLAADRRDLVDREREVTAALQELRQPKGEAPDPDEPITRAELEGQLEKIRTSMEQNEGQRNAQFQQEEQRRYIGTIDTTVDDFLGTSKNIADKDDRDDARDMILARLWKNPGPENADSHTLSKHVRNICAEVEGRFLSRRDRDVKGYVSGKKTLRETVPQVPKGGAPAQQTQKPAKTLDALFQRMDAVTKRYDKRRSG